MHWRYTSDVILAVETGLWLKTCTGSKIQFSENTGRIFEDKLQQGKTGNVTNRDLGNMQHRPPKAWDHRLKHARTKENVTSDSQSTVDKIVGLLNHKGQKQTYHSTCQISKETDITQYSIKQIIRKCSSFTNKLLLLVFLHLIDYCPQNAPAKKFWKSVNNWRRYRQK